MTAVQAGPPPGTGAAEGRRSSTVPAAAGIPTRGAGAPGRTDPVFVVAMAMAVAAAWLLLYAVALSGLQQHGAQTRLYAEFRSELANETAPASAPIRYGRPVALLSIPGAGIDRAVVVEGTTGRQLADGPGHKADTPLPGQSGDAVILGRSLAFGGPFGAIPSLRRSAPITVTTAQGTFTYVVTDLRQGADKALRPAGRAELTLVTAGRGWLGRLTPSGVVYVDAALVKGKVQPLPAELPAIGQDSLPMAIDRGAVVPLIFWMEALVAAGAGAVIAWRRWGRWQSWMVGFPLIGAAAWGTCGQLLQLLPNLL